MKTVKFITLGCKVNQYDTQRMRESFSGSGFKEINNGGKADVYVINTCTVTSSADHKSRSFIHQCHRRNPMARIVVTGCYTELDSDYIAGIPGVTHIIRNRDRARVAEILNEDNKPSPAAARGISSFSGHTRAFLKIQDGCNNFCSYCVVPYLRGPEESRPLPEIVNEVKMLSRQGVKEVTLLGQNVNSYGASSGRGHDFADLLQEIGMIDGIERIRFTTSHPKDISDRLIRCFMEVDKLCEHIHLPVQAGSDRILEMMNRGYTVKEYVEKVDKLRSACPQISITSDIIVGFPGETERDYQATIDLMEKIRFDNIFSFHYSKRAGTAAARLVDTVSESVKRERLQSLQALQEKHTLEKHEALVGDIAEILVEGVSKNSQEDISGRTRTNKILNFKGNHELVGKTVHVMITGAYLHSLRGRLSEEEVIKC